MELLYAQIILSSLCEVSDVYSFQYFITLLRTSSVDVFFKDELSIYSASHH